MDLGLFKSDKTNPRENANFLSVATLWYTLPTFLLGRKKEFEVTDLYKTLSAHKSKLLGDKIEQLWKNEEVRATKLRRKPSLVRVLFKMFGLEYILFASASIIGEVIARLLQPIMLGELLAYYAPGQTSVTKSNAYWYAFGVVACSLIQVLMLPPIILVLTQIGMKMRIASCSLIYRKVLKLSKTALEETSTGQILNLLSNDVARFDFAMMFLQFIWIGPLQTVIGSYLMYREVGITAIIGITVLLLFIPLQFGVAKVNAKLRLKSAYRTDGRVRLMSEIISGIQVIKMYTWEKPFSKFISLARKNEIKFVRIMSYLRGSFFSLFMYAGQLYIFITIVSHTFVFGEHFTTKKLFILISFFNILRISICTLFAHGVMQIAEASMSIKRLNKFLLLDEKSTKGNSMNERYSFTKNQFLYAISITDGVAKWSSSSSDCIFEDLNVKIKKGSLVAIVGPVGSGKSSLLKLILGELPLTRGRLGVEGSISYASQEPWLFDGTIRQNILFDEIFSEFRYKTVTSKSSLEMDLAILPNADMTIVGEKGIVLSGGQRARVNFARAVYQKADIYLLDDPFSAVDTQVAKELFDECVYGFLKGKTVIMVTHKLQFLEHVDDIIILQNGKIGARGTFEQLLQSGLDFAKLLKTEREDEEGLAVKCEIGEPDASLVAAGENVVIRNKEQQSSGVVSKDAYTAYMGAGSNWFIMIVMIFLFVVAQLVMSVGDVYVSIWISAEEQRYNSISTEYKTRESWNISTETYIYAGIVGMTVIFALSRNLFFYTFCMRSSVKLHHNMFTGVVGATMRFFNENSSGRILNRFSKDMGTIDDYLPTVMLDSFQYNLALLGMVAVIAYVNPWFLIPTAILFLFFCFLRNCYLATTRNVKRLEGITRSPIFAHINSTLQGLLTVRACRAETTLKREFDSLQDLHSVVWFLFLSSNQAFSYYLDLSCVILLCFLTFTCLFIENSLSGGNVGLIITQSLAIVGMLQWATRQSAEMENQMTSVERVLEYTKLEPEGAEDDQLKKPQKPWPSNGEVQFVDVYLNYSPNEPPVLKNLSFTIKPLEKVGIVGRTGAGKSSLINALFQLAETRGLILIDGLDVKEVNLNTLRSNISIITQEPFLFSGTIRRNLDPLDEYPDSLLWRALERVELKAAIGELNLGLNSVVLAGGSNFSVGQRQLICLARAILRDNKILVLDEATANIDLQTDALVQKTIRKRFTKCTVLTIAHRLNTVMDADKVLVMDSGHMVEFDHPYKLLQNSNGVFYGMVLQTGPHMSEILTKIAKESYGRNVDSTGLRRM
ncbi:hypothetical protein RI129_005426 [Pyrocoelia pectoralis]|uniref:Uncharacterized protein n=1 Tax=Pyrocoelia pectoralis TaxID=417401 RepID=A0AAN7VFM5_9COLE